MRVLITGGAGFIGSHLADRLLARGDQVVIIDNYATSRRDNLTPHDSLTVIEDTIADTSLVHRVFDTFQPDMVVHAAAAYKDPDNWNEDVLTNVLGSANVVQAARNVAVKRLIYFQTALCYGLRPVEQPITLAHAIRPEGSSYAISKTSGEQYIELSGLDYISFRLANAYGPRNLSGPLPTFYHRLTNNMPCYAVDTRRDFIYIDDLIDVVLMAIDGKGRRGVYHISSGTDYSIKELFEATVKALNITLSQDVEVRPRNPDDVYTILLDPTQTQHDFHWKTVIPLEQGVRTTIEWYKQHGITQTFTHLRPVETKTS
jgi:UDP-glucose 4-epimerase